jgi:hypothetical protein
VSEGSARPTVFDSLVVDRPRIIMFERVQAKAVVMFPAAREVTSPPIVHRITTL